MHVLLIVKLKLFAKFLHGSQLNTKHNNIAHTHKDWQFLGQEGLRYFFHVEKVLFQLFKIIQIFKSKSKNSKLNSNFFCI